MLNEDIGVIVGRFQVPTLTKAHVDLIRNVSSRHKAIIICLGISPVPGSFENPLDYNTRMIMLTEEMQTYCADTKYQIIPVYDRPSDQEWSVNLDRTIRSIAPRSTVRLYGGRDSFVPYYSGRIPVTTFESTGEISGTESRRQTCNLTFSTREERAAFIAGTQSRFPHVIQCVDAIVFRGVDEYVFGVRDGCVRFIGGFVDPRIDNSLEEAAEREASEEIHGAQVINSHYLASSKVDDWRYRGQDRIFTALYKVTIADQTKLTASDDIENLFLTNCDLEGLNVMNFYEQVISQVQKKGLTFAKEHIPLLAKASHALS